MPCINTITSATNMINDNQNQYTATSTTRDQKPKKIPGPKNAFNLWVNAQMKKILEENYEDNMGILEENGKTSIKLLTAKWNELDKSNKKPFIEEAKQLFKEHMRLYPDFFLNSKSKGFRVFCLHRQREIALKNPGMGKDEIRKLLAVEWKQLSENKKKPFFEEARRLRRQDLHPDNECQTNKIPRPTYAFNLWLTDHNNKILQKNGKINKKLIKEMWKKLDESDKKTFREKAKQIRKEHMRLNPNFYKKTSREKTKKFRKEHMRLNPDYYKKTRQALYAFYEHRRFEVELRNPGISCNEIWKLLGYEWKQLNENEKKPFIEEAQRLRQESVHPDNECHPRSEQILAAKATEQATFFYESPIEPRAFSTPHIGLCESEGKRPAIMNTLSALQFPSHATREHPAPFDADTSMIDFQHNPASTPSLTDAFNHRLYHIYRYYPQTGAPNTFIPDNFNHSDMFNGHYSPSEPRQKFQGQQISNLEPIRPIQNVPSIQLGLYLLSDDLEVSVNSSLSELSKVPNYINNSLHRGTNITPPSSLSSNQPDSCLHCASVQQKSDTPRRFPCIPQNQNIPSNNSMPEPDSIFEEFDTQSSSACNSHNRNIPACNAVHVPNSIFDSIFEDFDTNSISSCNLQNPNISTNNSIPAPDFLFNLNSVSHLFL